LAIWSINRDETGALLHTLPGGLGHALVVPIAIEAFRRLGVPGYLRDERNLWWRLNSEPTVARHEIEHSRHGRVAYNARSIAAARRENKLIRRELAGQTDFFVPVFLQGKHVATLVSGPVELHAPSGEEIEERWRTLTGRQAHPADGDFASYLSIVLGTLVLDGNKATLFEHLLRNLAQLLSGDGDADAKINQIDLMRAKLDSLRAVERGWKAVASMVDERQEHSWAAVELAWTLGELGLPRVPDRVLVGLTSERTGKNPVVDAVQRHAFQRYAAELARSMKDMIAGRVGDHGIVFLLATRRSADEQRGRLSELIDVVSSHARRQFGFSLHFGSSRVTRTLPLSRSYLAALAAAERALSEGTRLVDANATTPSGAASLRAMRFELGRRAEQGADSLGARFDHYAEVVRAESGYRLEVVRTNLQAGFEIVALRLADQGLLDSKSLAALSQGLEQGLEKARTINDLTTLYRRAVSDLIEAVQRPGPAQRERSLHRALDYIHRHFAEALSFAEVAKEAGFAPNYFSHLFKRRQGVTFERYVADLRIGHATRLLTNSSLEVARVAELSGFRSPQYFNAAFKKATGVTPLEYRRRPTSNLHPRRRSFGHNQK
jgi:AraC-like DNA-binding protein